mgnify:CR=1 FL=1
MNNPKRVFYILLSSLIGTILLGSAGYYLLDRQLASKANSLSQTKADLQVLEQQVDIFEDAKEKIEEFTFIEELASEVLPEGKLQGEAIAELKDFIIKSSMRLESISFGSSGDEVNVDTSQTQLLENVKGVRVLPTTVVLKSGATYANLLEFLQRIESNRRLMQVTSLDLVPLSENRNKFSTITVQLNIFLKDQND